ncbi:hypothetical protein [Cytobacillus sp. FSL H8-0458]|uniref:hypothetical protein n=1 Tax=Cytobacillus sp. FSL H8-0458 TaxID=2975346 RepID=UPI0030F93B96
MRLFILLDSRKLGVIYQRALEEIVLLLDCEYGSIVRANRNQYKIICTMENGQFEQTIYLINIGEVHAGEDLKQGKPIILENGLKKRSAGNPGTVFT